MNLTVATAIDAADAIAYRRDGYWLDGLVTDSLDLWAAERPGSTAIIDGEVLVTWIELRDRAYRTAASLRRIGIGHGDRVVVQLPNWHEFAVIYLALARIGAVIVPAMPIYRQSELRHMIKVTDASVTVVTSTFRGFDHLAMARGLREELPTLQHLVAVRQGSAELGSGEVAFTDLEAGEGLPADDELGLPPTADDGHIIGFTSGTEAGAKGCYHTWNTYSHSPRMQATLYHFGADDRELLPSPITHTAGLAGGFLKPLLVGGSVCLMDAWDPGAALGLVDRHQCTQATGATAFIAGMVEAYDPAVHNAASLQYFICGGAPVPQATVVKVRDTLPNCKVIACFGQTEGLLITSCTPEDPDDKVVSSDGRAIPGVQVEIRDEGGGSALGPNEVGQIVYRGPAAMLGYWRNAEATATIDLAGGWRRTGDLGYVDGDGYVRVTGREKDMIIRGGMNISAREVEELIAQHATVSAVAVVGLPDPTLGERACAFVVPVGDAPTLDELVGYLLEEHQLAKPKLPERLEIVESLPMTLTGKVQKFALRERVLAPKAR